MAFSSAPAAVAPRAALTGRRGWAIVTTLSLVLTLLVAEQLPGRDAAATPLAPAVPVAAAREVDTVERPLAGRRTTQPTAAVEPAPAAAPPPPAPAPPAPPPPAPAPPAAPAAAPAAAAPPPAPAAGLCSGEGWQQRRGQAALASLRAGAERTGFQVTFSGARKGYMGLTHLNERRIEMFVRSCDVQSDALLRHVMAHELGHAYDTTHMTSASRAAYKAARGIPAGTPWYGCSGCTDFATPAGDYAEVYAQWARGGGENRSRMGGTPGPTELAALAAQFFGA